MPSARSTPPDRLDLAVHVEHPLAIDAIRNQPTMPGHSSVIVQRRDRLSDRVEAITPLRIPKPTRCRTV